MKYRVVTYDICGNPKDGYEINEEHPFGTVEISDSATNKEICKILHRHGKLITSDLRRLEVEDYAVGRIEIYWRKGRFPLCGLIECEEKYEK